MITVVFIILGLVGLLLLVWGVSEIQIKVWTKGVEKFLNNKYNQIKTKEDGTEKK